METVKLKRRKDGVTQISRDGAMPPGDRYVVMAAVFFLASCFFLADVVPFLLVLGLIGACVLGEAVLFVDTLAQRFRPVAEVHDIREARWRR